MHGFVALRSSASDYRVGPLYADDVVLAARLLEKVSAPLPGTTDIRVILYEFI